MSGIDHYVPPEGYHAIAEATRPMLAFMRELRTIDDLEPRREFNFYKAEDEIARAKRVIARFPNLPDLQQKQAALENAVRQRGTEAEAAPVIAGMLGAIPTAAKSVSPSYVEALLAEATAEEENPDVIAYMGSNGFSLPAITLAARRIVQTKNFAPTVAEFTEAGRAARRELWSAWGLTSALVLRRREADAIVRIVEDPLSGDDEVPF